MLDLAAIEQLAPVRWLALAPIAYPALSALHIVGIALLVGPIAVVDLRLAGWLSPRFDPALDALANAAAAGLAIAAATGVWLFAVRAGEYAANAAFLAKLALVAAGVANALLLRLAGRGRPLAGRVGTPGGRASGLASLALWLSAVLAGRWIAFV